MNDERYNYYLQMTYQDPDLQSIIFGVLKRLHIDPGHCDRADLVQEARLTVATALVELEKVDLEMRQRNIYIYQKVYWRLLDILRRINYLHSHTCFSIDSESDPEYFQNLMKDFSTNTSFCWCERRTIMKLLVSKLTLQQRKYINLCCIDYSDGEIAHHLGISKQVVANLRKRIIDKGRKLIK